MNEYAQELEVGLYVRGLAPNGAETMPASVYRELRELEAEGAIGGCEVHVWGRKVPLNQSAFDDDELCRDVLDTVAEFEDWAAREDVLLQGFVRRAHAASPLTEEREELVLPVMCLAVRQDDDLLCVAPFADDDGTHSVTDCLSWLASARPPEDRSVDVLLP